jgi:hypothetical protein
VLAAGFSVIAAASVAVAEPAERFNAPGQRHANVCVRLAGPQAALRFGDGAPTGFGVDDQRAFDEDGRCPGGTVRLDLHETIPSPAGALVFHRGGNGYVDGGNVKYGHLATGEIADALPAPTPSSGGRGAPCPRLLDAVHRVRVRTIPASMHYKRPEDLPTGSNRGTSFEHYGDPAADQGDREDIHYTYLLWSFVNVRGGGMVRALLAPDQAVLPCDVDPVTMDAWDRAGQVNGRVTARYVRALAGGCALYGWMVWSHDYFGDTAGPLPHALPAEGAAPPEPAPDPACPVAEPGVPPTVTTGDAVAGEDGTATLGGSVNPHGVNTSYRFEFGPGSDYGAATEPAALRSAERDAPVSAQATGLQPGATYHFRLVAESTHGVSYGDDRTVTIPPPEATAVGLSVRLSGLAVRPGRFRRARSRRGAPARIRYALSAPATVTLTFLRRRRGARRARWRRIGGSLRQAASAGKTSVRFGGWVRGRRLPPGRYRVRGVATAEGGQPGRPRYGYVTLR